MGHLPTGGLVARCGPTWRPAVMPGWRSEGVGTRTGIGQGGVGRDPCRAVEQPARLERHQLVPAGRPGDPTATGRGG